MPVTPPPFLIYQDPPPPSPTLARAASISHQMRPLPISIHQLLPFLWERPQTTSNSQLLVVCLFHRTYPITCVGVASSLPSKTLLLELVNSATTNAKYFPPSFLSLSLIHPATPSSRASAKLMVPSFGVSPCAQVKIYPQVRPAQYPPLWVLIAPTIYPMLTSLFDTSILRHVSQSNQHGLPPSNVATTIPGPASLKKLHQVLSFV